MISPITTIINIKDGEPDIYIGRDSKWGNPFKMSEYLGRSRVLELYKEWLLENKVLMNDIHELEGKVLGCHCKPKKCHGDILCEIVNRRSFQL